MMKQYTGTKIVGATPMSFGKFCDKFDKDVPEGRSPDEEGYIVEYPDDGINKPNHKDYKGYISWSPKEVFEKYYTGMTSMLTFGDAMKLLESGQKVAREGWNGKNMFIFLVDGSTFQVNRKPLLGIYPEGTKVDYQPHIDMRTAEGTIVPWTASQSDLLARDWMVIGKIR